jgi:hypothetical protein
MLTLAIIASLSFYKIKVGSKANQAATPVPAGESK